MGVSERRSSPRARAPRAREFGTSERQAPGIVGVRIERRMREDAALVLDNDACARV